MDAPARAAASNAAGDAASNAAGNAATARARGRWGTTPFGLSHGNLVRYAACALLLVTAVIHIRVAPDYSHNPDNVKISQLFYLQAGLSILCAVALALWDRAEPWWLGASICLSSVVAAIESVYVAEKHVGFFPQLYEPLWRPEKVLSTSAEAAFMVVWLGVSGVRLYGNLKRKNVGAPS